jgi:major vault protein
MAEEERARKDGDMVLAPNEWMLVRDQTKGNVDVFVGPCKTGLSGTDQPVVFDERTKRFQNVTLERAIQTFMTAPEGFYIVLKNPAVGEKHPAGQGKATNADLTVGRKVNIPGPVSFPLWPGQMAKVLKGHHIRSNQYLLVRVYDAEAARQNWKKAVVQPVGSGSTESDPVRTEASKDPDFSVLTSGGLTMGQLLVIRGTDVTYKPRCAFAVRGETKTLVFGQGFLI